MKRLLFIAVMVLGLSGCETTTKILGQGEVEKVEYLQGNFSAVPKTIIKFKNGGYAVMLGNHSIPYRKVIAVRIETPREIIYKIEELK